MARLAVIVMSFICVGVSAMTWQPGAVVLAGGGVLTGQISRQSTDLILVRSGDQTHVLPAHRVHSFRYYDTDNNINRKFVALCVSQSAVTNYSFYETVAVGRLTILRKQREFHERFDESDAGSFEFFILSDGQLNSLRKFKFNYYNLVKTALERDGIETSGFNPNEPCDAVKMILLFNQLPGPPSVTAS